MMIIFFLFFSSIMAFCKYSGERAVKFHEQHVRLAQAGFAVGVNQAHGMRVDQLHAGDGHAQLNGFDNGLHGAVDRKSVV